MSVRVVARIRPLLKTERETDTIVEPAPLGTSDSASIVRIPNPKNAAESFSFNFNRVYDQSVTQQELFENEGPRDHVGWQCEEMLTQRSLTHS